MYIIEFLIYNIPLALTLFLVFRTKHVYSVGLLTTIALVLIFPITETALTENITITKKTNITGQKIEFVDFVNIDKGIKYSGSEINLRTKDGVYLIVNETTGQPGYETLFIFTEVWGIPSQITTHDAYAGGAGHDPHYEILNQCKVKAGLLADPWDRIRDISDGGAFNSYNMSLIGDCYKDEHGTVILKDDHEDTGTGNHFRRYDQVILTTHETEENYKQYFIFWIYPALGGLILINLGLKSGLMKRVKGKALVMRIKGLKKR